jgi:hypothetical protein
VASLKGKLAVDRIGRAGPRPPSNRKGATALKKRVKRRGTVGKRSGKERTNGRAEDDWDLPLVLDREELVARLQDCLTDFATEVGMRVACLLFDKQVDISFNRAASEGISPRGRLSVRRRASGRNGRRQPS